MQVLSHVLNYSCNMLLKTRQHPSIRIHDVVTRMINEFSNMKTRDLITFCVRATRSLEGLKSHQITFAFID